MVKIRLVIPSFRDSARLAVFLPELCREAGAVGEVSVHVVDDGSGPREADAVRSLVAEISKTHACLGGAILLERNLGKGGAVYAGWDAGDGTEQWLGFVDADGATPAREVVRLLRIALDDPPDADMIIASRVLMMGHAVERRLQRHLVGRVFATLASLLVGLVVYDSQCGCKLLKSDFYRKVRPSLSEMRFAFDIDLLAHLARVGARIRECPVDWRDVPGSKVSVLRDGFQMLLALVRVRARLARTGPAPEAVS